MSTEQVITKRNRTAPLPFRELVEKRVRQEPGFGAALLEEALERLLVNDVASAQLLLHEVVNGTIGFQALARATGLMEKSLMRMLSTKGNPQARNLFLILHAIQNLAGVRLEVRAAVDSKRDFVGRE